MPKSESADRHKLLFEVKDCTIIRRMGGVDAAVNLRELLQRIKVCPIECLYYHFCETLIRPTFDDPKFRNDFALWSAHKLRDNVLAEKLGIINPYSFGTFEGVREKTIEIIDERLSELVHIPWVPPGDGFTFMRAATVVFPAGIELYTPDDFLARLPDMSPSSIYYHFLEARRRTPDKVDDFSFWLQFFEPRPEAILRGLETIDFYFLNLTQLKQNIIKTLKDI
jgi:hypothetical protein